MVTDQALRINNNSVGQFLFTKFILKETIIAKIFLYILLIYKIYFICLKGMLKFWNWKEL